MLLNWLMKTAKVDLPTAPTRPLPARCATSPDGSAVIAIILSTSFTCQKIVPSSLSFTLSLVRTSLLKNMTHNTQESEFKRFVLRVIAAQLPTDGKHMHTVETAFRCLDRNGDGILSVEEVIKGLKRHLGKSAEDDELDLLFSHIDRDASGTINVGEFVAASMPQTRSTCLPVLWEAFNAFDKDRSASVDFDEIDRIVREIEGAMLSQSQLNGVCEEIRKELGSVSHNGTIDFDQFVYIMSNSSPAFQDNVNKDINRFLWETCGIDKYKVRHLKVADQERWDITQTKPRGPRSVYRHRSNRKRVESEHPDAAG